jgi:Dehydrogenases with different specificities (related to short-chain alcohol dehydrogenases)
MNLYHRCTHRYFICNRIGFAIAERLAADGASVVVSSRKESNVTNAVEKLKASGYSVSGVVCHVSKASDRERLIKEAQDRFGGIDILVSNAAVNPGVGPVLEVIYWVILSLHLL